MRRSPSGKFWVIKGNGSVLVCLLMDVASMYKEKCLSDSCICEEECSNVFQWDFNWDVICSVYFRQLYLYQGWNHSGPERIYVRLILKVFVFLFCFLFLHVTYRKSLTLLHIHTLQTLHIRRIALVLKNKHLSRFGIESFRKTEVLARVGGGGS